MSNLHHLQRSTAAAFTRNSVIHLCSCAINTALPDSDIDGLTKHSVSGIGLQETMKAYICVLWIFCGLSLAVPLSEDLEVKEEDMRIVNGHESIPGNMLL